MGRTSQTNALCVASCKPGGSSPRPVAQQADDAANGRSKTWLLAYSPQRPRPRCARPSPHIRQTLGSSSWLVVNLSAQRVLRHESSGSDSGRATG